MSHVRWLGGQVTVNGRGPKSHCLAHFESCALFAAIALRRTSPNKIQNVTGQPAEMKHTNDHA